MSVVTKSTVWIARVAIATIVLSGIGLIGDAAEAAEQVSSDTGQATWAIGVFIAVWLVASLRIRRNKGRWSLGFEPAKTSRSRSSRSVSRAFSGGGRSGGAGASGNY